MRKAPDLLGRPRLSNDEGNDQPSSIVRPGLPSRPDPRAAWLLRASARYHLVRNGMMSLNEAFDDHFICDLFDAIPNACPCHFAINRNFERIARELRKERLRKWRLRLAHD